ncbi:hypothetical protein HII31_12439 [Pseudocercospora fuligena]|uniref:Uncharacterized protein n=1 Tax=Pseudocercospora fuligena TaxID=685502 RepID=A0A8H6R997_9PEZI|nr:hypothetical protein HII31_12439 [Pseudocercospora fuligena]
MGITNIHYASQLTDRANRSSDVQALIQPLQKPVFIVSGSMSQNDVDKYGWCLQTSHVGCWITQDEESQKCKIVEADAPMSIPQIRVSSGLAPSKEGTQRDYLLVIEGVSGASKAKVVIEDSIEKAATAMLHAALNGFSTVFSAAIRQRKRRTIFAASIGPLNGRFRKVDSFLDPATDPSGTVTVDLLC